MFYIILLPRFILTVWNLYSTQQDLRNTKKYMQEKQRYIKAGTEKYGIDSEKSYR